MITQLRIALTGLVLLTGCKKEDAPSPAVSTGTTQVFGVPIPGIFTWDMDTNTRGYLKTSNGGGVVLKDEVPASYPLNDLAADDNCRVEMIGRDLSNGPVAYGVNMQGTERWWVPIDQGGDLVVQEEDLGMTVQEMPDFGGYWCWIRHSQGSVGGDPVYAMESFAHPGWYWSLQFPMSCGQCIKLVPHSDPADAQGFIFR